MTIHGTNLALHPTVTSRAQQLAQEKGGPVTVLLEPSGATIYVGAHQLGPHSAIINP